MIHLRRCQEPGLSREILHSRGLSVEDQQAEPGYLSDQAGLREHGDSRS